MRLHPYRLQPSAILQIFFAALAAAQVPSGYNISTVAGNASTGYSGDGGAAILAQLANPTGIALDSSKKLYIADQSNYRIRQVSGGVITTVAGNGTKGFLGDAAAATSAEISNALGVAVDSSGNIYIADTSNSRIRKVATGGIISTIAGIATVGFGGDGAAATLAMLNGPTGITVDSGGNLFFVDLGNQRIRKITTNGTISTVAGNGQLGSGGDGGPATGAALYNPQGVAVDASGNVYIADSGNHRIRRVDTGGIITTIAGTGTSGFSGDGGPATSARLNTPRSVAVDSAGNLYITEYLNARVRKIVPGGTIFTIAGSGRNGYTGDGGSATNAALSFPTGLALDSSGNVYFSDTGNNVVRMLTPAVSNAPPSVNDKGVVSAAAFGGGAAVAPGSWIEIYGSNLALTTHSWATSDFIGVNAPAALGGTAVSIGGASAFIDYVSPGQVNVQVPSTVAPGAQPLVVNTASGTSSAYTVTVNATQPGLLSPPSFKIGGTQYVTALFNDGTTYVLPPGAISNATSRRAKPGDAITLYGVGFGPVTPSIPAGQTVQQLNALSNSFQILFGSTAAQVTYSGLAPGAVGLYQFNLVVPAVPDSDSVPVTFTLGGVAGTQTLFTAVASQ